MSAPWYMHVKWWFQFMLHRWACAYLHREALKTYTGSSVGGSFRHEYDDGVTISWTASKPIKEDR